MPAVLRAIFWLIVTLQMPHAAATQEFRTGQRVVVTTDRAVIKAGSQAIDVVDRGDILSVANIRGSWLLVGRGHSGWIEKGQVIALDAAPDHFNKVVAQNPLDPGARAARAAIWVDEKSWNAAIAEASEALRQNPQCLSAWLVRSAAYRGNKAFAQAQSDAQAAIRLAPTLPCGFIAAGDTWRNQGHFARAVADYSAALERDATNAHVCLRRGQARLATHQSEQWTQAVTDLREAIALAEHDPTCQREAQLARGQVYIMQGNLSQARTEFTDLLNQNGDDVSALIGRGTAHGLDRQYELALADLTRAIQLDPKNPLVYVANAEVRARQYNLRGAMRDVAEALKLDPSNAAAQRIRGEVLVKQRKWGPAIEAFGQALALDPNDPAIYLARAKAYTGKGEVFAAAADREQALKIDPPKRVGNTPDDAQSTAEQLQSSQRR